ncbi:MAG: TIGR01777 family oxidoreductase [Vicinamibacterales bacterium]
MRIVVAGGTGFLGSPLAETCAEDGHDVRVLTRSLPPGESQHESGTGVPGITRVGWQPNGQTGPWADTVTGADAVINLAGASLAARRWTPQFKAELRDSRVLPTRSLVAAIRQAAQPPAVFISASGVNYYGTGNEAKTEASPAGADFMSHLCEDWEAEAFKAARDGLRIVVTRSGFVLERSGGGLPRMVRPFKFFVGGPLASGRQYMSWIHRLDWVEMIRWIVQTPEAAGALNLTAPHPVTNREFARALGRALKRPSLVPVPRLAVKLVAGELADYIVTGQRVLPARAQALGYHFRYPEIDIAFRGIYGE